MSSNQGHFRHCPSGTHFKRPTQRRSRENIKLWTMLIALFDAKTIRLRPRWRESFGCQEETIRATAAADALVSEIPARRPSALHAALVEKCVSDTTMRCRRPFRCLRCPCDLASFRRPPLVAVIPASFDPSFRGLTFRFYLDRHSSSA